MCDTFSCELTLSSCRPQTPSLKSFNLSQLLRLTPDTFDPQVQSGSTRYKAYHRTRPADEDFHK
jgi:hypothetical protein